MSENDFCKVTNGLMPTLTRPDVRGPSCAPRKRCGTQPAGRDAGPANGPFVWRDPLTAAQQTAGLKSREVTKAVTIGGKEFSFTGDALDVERQIGAALQVAEALKTAPIPEPVAHVKTQAERDLDAFKRTELDLKFRRGELTSSEYLEHRARLANISQKKDLTWKRQRKRSRHRAGRKLPKPS